MDHLSHQPDEAAIPAVHSPEDDRSALLTHEQVRVLGCLIEKERTTPDEYPLTANALMRACNQSTSRDPVVSYSVGDVERSLAELKPLGLVRFVHQPTGRATTKYRHRVDEHFDLDPAACALLGLLMLRGPQTSGELKTRSERMHAFSSLGEVNDTLQALAGRDEPLAVLLERQVGQKEARWAHLLAGPPEVRPQRDMVVGERARATAPSGELAALTARVEQLEAQLLELREALGLENS